MESIKSDSSLPGEAVSQPSYNKMNQKDVFQVPKNLDAVEFNSQKNPIDELPWVSEGVAFPCGTKFRCKYKGFFYYGDVKSGALMLNGKEFLSPSEAAVTITRSPVDGWLLWDCKLPGASSWVNLHTLKQMK